MAQSVLAQALQRLFDETKFFEHRETWARFCGVKEEVIEEWLTDQQLPEPHFLWTIIDCLEGSAIPQDLVEEFKKLYSSTLISITPLASKTKLLSKDMEQVPVDQMTLGEYVNFKKYL